MKFPRDIYIALAFMGLLAAVAIPATIYKSGSEGLPIWGAAVSPGPLSAAHKFLTNKCESCHAPNQGIVAEKCITCHASAPELIMKPATAFHANLTDCRGCHTEHQGENVRPIHMDHAALNDIAAQVGDKPIQLECQSCHAFKDKHQGFFGEQCSTCHSEKNWKIPGFLHPSPTSTSCSECHKPPPSHYMMHFGMVDQGVTGNKEARVDQCYACHQTDSFNDIKGIGWYKMH